VESTNAAGGLTLKVITSDRGSTEMAGIDSVFRLPAQPFEERPSRKCSGEAYRFIRVVQNSNVRLREEAMNIIKANQADTFVFSCLHSKT
jgi:hypothetical protein